MHLIKDSEDQFMIYSFNMFLHDKVKFIITVVYGWISQMWSTPQSSHWGSWQELSCLPFFLLAKFRKTRLSPGMGSSSSTRYFLTVENTEQEKAENEDWDVSILICLDRRNARRRMMTNIEVTLSNCTACQSCWNVSYLGVLVQHTTLVMLVIWESW